MWPFGKKKNDDDVAAEAADRAVDGAAPDRAAEPGADAATDAVAGTAADGGSGAAADSAAAPASAAGADVPAAPENGPFDIADAKPEEFDFSDFAKASVNLGSMLLAIPHEGDIQVEMGPQGPTMLHVVGTAGRITPVAFSAPTSGGLWEKSSREIAEGLEGDGLKVRIEDGPWGPEVVGVRDEMQMRIIGANGPRWMLRMTLAGPTSTSDELAELGRGIMARCFVNRGEHPMPAGQPLPVTLPVQMAEQIRRAYAQQQAKQGQPAQGQPNQDQSAQGDGTQRA